MDDTLRKKYRLYTVEEVAALFPCPEGAPAQRKHLKQVEELIRQTGSYRSFGDTALLTEADVGVLIRSLAVKGPEAPQPTEVDDGWMVFIGNRLDPSEDVFVTWCRQDEVDKAVMEVRSILDDVDLIDFVHFTYGAYLSWVEAQSAFRRRGKWYHRTKKFNAAMAALSPREDNDNG